MSSCNTGSLRKPEVLCSKYMLLIRGNQEAGDKYVCVSSIRSENCVSTSWLSGAFTAKSTRTWFKISGISFIPLQIRRSCCKQSCESLWRLRRSMFKCCEYQGHWWRMRKLQSCTWKWIVNHDMNTKWYLSNLYGNLKVRSQQTVSAELLLSLVQKEWRHKITI